MTYVQATQGGGGWPMSVFLTPELQPFLGGATLMGMCVQVEGKGGAWDYLQS